MKKILDKIPVDDQYDVELHGCDTDCEVFRRSGAWETNKLKEYVNIREPSTEELQLGMDVATKLGIVYCYIDLTPQTSTLL